MDGINWLRFLLSFVFVLGLIGLCAMGLRRWGGKLAMPRAGAASARLKVVEMCYLGPRQRLVLVRRDGVEHLLLLSPERGLVVERAIGKESISEEGKGA